MKKLVLTLTAVAGLSLSALAQGTIQVDNANGAGGPTATALGLFFNDNGTAYTAATLNVTVLGGPNASSLTPIATFVGPAALVSFGGGVYADPTGGAYVVPGVGSQQPATLQVLAWRGSAATYAAAASSDRFLAWNGSAQVPSDTFTFVNGTGGPTPAPPKLPQSLDGMPAMILAPIPEPSTMALAGLGAVAMLLFRRRQ